MKYATLFLLLALTSVAAANRLGQNGTNHQVPEETPFAGLTAGSNSAHVDGRDPFPNPPLPNPCTNPAIQCSNHGSCNSTYNCVCGDEYATWYPDGYTGESQCNRKRDNEVAIILWTVLGSSIGGGYRYLGFDATATAQMCFGLVGIAIGAVIGCCGICVGKGRGDDDAPLYALPGLIIIVGCVVITVIWWVAALIQLLPIDENADGLAIYKNA